MTLIEWGKTADELEADYRAWAHNRYWFPTWCPHNPVECCRSCMHFALFDADPGGDGPLVNAICAYGRKRWGECLHW